MENTGPAREKTKRKRTHIGLFSARSPRRSTHKLSTLSSHPQHNCAKKLFNGCGGVLSFEVAGDSRVADAVISRLKLPISAPSLGGIGNTDHPPVQTSHSGLTDEERRDAGISERLIRVAVGIEAAEDLCADFEQALRGVEKEKQHG